MRYGPWLEGERAKDYAATAVYVRLWDDGSLAAIVHGDAGWEVWAPGERLALGRPEYHGVGLTVDVACDTCADWLRKMRDDVVG